MRSKRTPRAWRLRLGVELEYIKKPTNYRKEDRIRKILADRGTHPGLVHVFSVMELCSSYRPWHDKQTGLTHLRPDHGKCVYYYFYFIDEVLGLCFLSVPTWCPFRTQFYFNGHNWLASKLKAAGVTFELQDNAIVSVSNWRKAQDLSDDLAVAELHARMDAAVGRYVPDLAPLGRYHWSVAQAEYATDIVFRSAADLAPLYGHLLRTSIHAIKADDIATFLGRSPATADRRAAGGDFSRPPSNLPHHITDNTLHPRPVRKTGRFTPAGYRLVPQEIGHPSLRSDAMSILNRYCTSDFSRRS